MGDADGRRGGSPPVAPVVQVEHLTRRFGAFVAVDDVSFQVRRGEIFGFLGSNGAGKTTVIRVLCGLLAPTAGNVQVLGLDVARRPEAVKRRLGYMSQRFSLYEDLTVGQNIRFFGGVYALSPARLRERTAWAVAMAGLAGMEGRLTRELASGWKQRLALACALLHEPEIVFLDEPTGGVDPIARRRFWESIGELAAGGTTVFVTTHYMDEAEYCHRLALMHGGRLVCAGSVAELRQAFSGCTVLEVQCAAVHAGADALDRLTWVAEAAVFGTRIHAVVPDWPQVGQQVVQALAAAGQPGAAAAPILPSLEDVFIHAIQRSQRQGEMPGAHPGGARTAPHREPRP